MHPSFFFINSSSNPHKTCSFSEFTAPTSLRGSHRPVCLERSSLTALLGALWRKPNHYFTSHTATSQEVFARLLAWPTSQHGDQKMLTVLLFCSHLFRKTNKLLCATDECTNGGNTNLFKGHKFRFESINTKKPRQFVRVTVQRCWSAEISSPKPRTSILISSWLMHSKSVLGFYKQ